MDRRKFLAASLVVAASAAVPGLGFAAPVAIDLPAPKSAGGLPLLEALKKRRSERAFSGKELPLDVLSDLLWAANGVNRPESGRRTAPSCKNWQEISVYAVLASGTYLYDPKKHALSGVAEGDLRALTGKQGFAAEAPLNLVFAADLSKMENASAEDKIFYAGTDTGLVSQNVYLYCASAGLATVVRASIDKPALAKALGLGSEMLITLAQSVGYPK